MPSEGQLTLSAISFTLLKFGRSILRTLRIFSLPSFSPSAFSSAMPPSLRRLSLPLMALAALLLVGGHWAVLRGAAWARMLTEFRGEGASWSQAVDKTFSGEFPCEWCRALDAAGERERERRQDLQCSGRFDLAPPVRELLFLVPVYQVVGYDCSKDAEPPEGAPGEVWFVPRSVAV